jgi:23S rRNA pseudouridine1911/1915/1917 synthase
MDCAIVGDVKYGFPEANKDGSICLHARALRFMHPVKKEWMNITAPLPENELWHYFSEIE